MVQRIRAQIFNELHPNEASALFRRLFNMGMAGNVYAATEVLRTLLGPPIAADHVEKMRELERKLEELTELAARAGGDPNAVDGEKSPLLPFWACWTTPHVDPPLPGLRAWVQPAPEGSEQSTTVYAIIDARRAIEARTMLSQLDPDSRLQLLEVRPKGWQPDPRTFPPKTET